MTMASRAISAYVQTGVESGVPEADSHKLVAMLFDGALSAIADARLKLKAGDIPGRGSALSKAIAIVEQGLRASLDKAKGGELAARLDGLYEYIVGRLFHANLRSEAEPLDEVSKLLAELQEGWTGIGAPQHEAALA